MRRFKDLTKEEKREYILLLFLLPPIFFWDWLKLALKSRTLPKRAVAVCLAVVMVAVMFPATVFAADTHTHCICGATHASVGDHTAEESVTWNEWNGTDTITYDSTTKTAYVYLSNDAERSGTLTVESGYTLNLCLNGHTLKNTAFNTRVINIDGGTLNLTDCGSTGTITGGSLTAGYSHENYGAGVKVTSGMFYMYGGIISGNTANPGYGGGVAVEYGGSFTLYGGAIRSNETNAYGGGVNNYGTFIMYGGEISNNTANTGGGVFNSSPSTIIAGGSIINNTANGSPSGGIYVNQPITLSGKPNISGNKYGSNEGTFDICKNYSEIQVTEDFAPTASPITVSVEDGWNDYVFLKTVDSSVNVENYIRYFQNLSEYPLYKKDGAYYAGFAIIEQPSSENNYTVKVTSDNGLSSQWYKKVSVNKVLTNSDVQLRDGRENAAYNENNQSFISSSGRLEGAISLNAGDQLIVSSQSQINDVMLNGGWPTPAVEKDGNTYTFTVTSTGDYYLVVRCEPSASVTLQKNGSEFVEVDGQTALTLDTTNLEDGEYKCELVWNRGTNDTYDDIEAWSEVVTYPPTYTVTWKNYDGLVLETDTVTHGSTPTYDGDTPTKPEDKNFTYTFSGWSPAVSTITGDAEYTAQFTAVSKRVEPAYTITIPATVNEGESFKVQAMGVVLNTDETLTVTLQSDFKFKNEQGAQLEFTINDGAIVNNAQLISVTGNGNKSNPLAQDSEVLRIGVAEEAKYSGTYTGTITFTIAVNTAEDTE